MNNNLTKFLHEYINAQNHYLNVFDGERTAFDAQYIQLINDLLPYVHSINTNFLLVV